MLTEEYFDEIVPRLMAADPSLTEETASTVAVRIGDTLTIIDGQVTVTVEGHEYRFPVSLWTDGAEEDVEDTEVP